MDSRKTFLRKTICTLLILSLFVAGCFSVNVWKRGWKKAKAADWDTTVLLVPRAERSLILIEEDGEIRTELLYDLVENEQIFSEDTFNNILESPEWDDLERAQWELLLQRTRMQQQLEAMYAQRQEALLSEYGKYREELKAAEEALREQEAREQAAKEQAAKAQAAKEQAAKEQAAKEEAAKKAVYCVVNYRGSEKITITQEDYQCLLRIVQAEAGGEDTYGRRLVANVILNRVLDDEFPNSVVGVVFQKGQFSPIRNGAYDRAVVSESTKAVVNEVLKDGVDEANGALYFFARKYTSAEKAAWFDTALTKVAEHGVHEFFK